MLKGLHHVGISVTNIDRSIDFYCSVLGMEVVQRCDFGDDVMDRITRLKEARGRAAMLRVGDRRVELFEFSTPVPKPAEGVKPVNDHGISHFCIEVDNLEHEYARLQRAGVEFHCEPQSFGLMKSTYARDPDGNVFELLELPPREQ